MSRTKATFILGPAGSGKTHRCIQSVRRRLAENPEGPPLLFLAPKQATFQIESQILADGELGGYTRLEILSFARLAERVLSELAPGSFRILSDEGRIMVLRSLLDKHSKRLRAFRAAAGFPALARELAAILQELGRQRIDTEKLDRLKEREELSPRLRNKLHDLAFLSGRYRQWLLQADLKDTESLLELAAEQLCSQTSSLFLVEELWLDGFAEMTAQELALLAAVVRRCRRANLCFCVDPGKPSNPSWLNLWATVDETWQRCRQSIERIPDIEMETVRLARDPERTRFSDSRPLQHLEARWMTPKPLPVATADVAITACTDPETEVIHAARAILRSVREEGIRFRQVAVIVRRLEGYATEIQQIFGRYQIPHFIDQRDSIRHHPAVILTQSALRLLAFDWRNADWFAALKTQLLGGDIEQTCHLENVALEFDIEGGQWRRALTSESCPHPLAESLEQHRQAAIAPFEELKSQLFADGASRSKLLSGTELAEAIRRFWERIGLADRLEKWDRPAAEAEVVGGEPAIHAAAWQQLQAWLENVRLAFADMRRPLADWIAILENGLGNLTVGVIPPSADQVLVGAIDRTRNPEVELALLLGLNESVFPARPRRHPLLTEADRKQLEQSAFRWLPPVKRRLAHERFYAYIACTRPRKKLAVSYAEQDAEGRPLNPSSIIAHLQRLFPAVKTRRFARKRTVDGWTEQSRPPLHEAEHWSELIRPLFRSQAGQTADFEVEKLFHSLETAPSLPPCSLLAEAGSERLSPAVAKILYTAADAKSAAEAATNTLRSSASRLEQFAACPFQFFLRSGLKAEERNQQRLDAKTLGSFQHAVLEKFHRHVQAQKRQWRDLTPQEARKLVAQIIDNAAGAFQHGIFQKNEAASLSLETASEKLQEFIAVTIQWMQQYDFDPHTAELSFGGKNDDVGPWTLPLEGGAQLSLVGKIDRLDLLRKPGFGKTAAVIIDYKSGNAALDPILLHNGIQLQLFIYLNAIAQHPEIAGQLKINSLAPAGAFLAPLQGKAPRSSHRNDAQTNHADRPKAFQWNGRFNRDHLRQLDNRPDQAKGDQIAYALNKDGDPIKSEQSAMPPQAFREMTRRLEETVRNLGQRIFAGDIAATPYKHKEKTPCAYCPYPAVCRIDAGAHPYRTLHSLAEEPEP